MVSEKENAFDEDHILTDDMNFNVAFAITYYDGNPNSIEDPDIGEMKAYYRQYGFKDMKGVKNVEIPTRPCTMADFGISSENKFDQDYYEEIKEDKQEAGQPYFFPVTPH